MIIESGEAELWLPENDTERRVGRFLLDLFWLRRLFGGFPSLGARGPGFGIHVWCGAYVFLVTMPLETVLRALNDQTDMG